MSMQKVKNFAIREGDAEDKGLIGLAHAIEDGGVKMILGIFHFLTRKIPELLNLSFEKLRAFVRIVTRITARFARAAVVIGVWILIVFGPAMAFAGIAPWAWMVLALTGSGWGLVRAKSKPSAAAPAVKIVVKSAVTPPPIPGARVRSHTDDLLNFDMGNDE